jgi:hypothetical protein
MQFLAKISLFGKNLYKNIKNERKYINLIVFYGRLRPERKFGK